VTGSGQGIGREIALELAKNGAKVVVADVSNERLKVAREIEAIGPRSMPVKCDVSKKEDAAALIQETLEEFRTLDILVNNAGVYPFKAFAEMTEEDWDHVLDVNLKGTFHCTKEAASSMIKQKHGRIVNIASIAGAVVGFPMLVHYSASKGGMLGFTRALALELAPHGINVNAIAPGPIETPGTKTGDKKTYEQTKNAVPLRRWGLPRDIANATVFLCSEKSSFITGQCLVVDGGYTLQ